MHPNGASHFFSFQGNEAYLAGLSSEAASLFQRGAAAAREHNDIPAHVHNLRWAGNSLMWANRYEEACEYLLRAISFDAHQAAGPADVFGAMTDVCLMSTRLRPCAQIHGMLAEARAYLAARKLECWDHRLDLIESITALLRGRLTEANELAHRAWQRSQAAHDGPRYDDNSYLNYLFRPALAAGDVAGMDAALQLIRQHSDTATRSGRFRQALSQALRLACDGISTTNRDEIDLLATEAVGLIRYSRMVTNECMDALRLLALLGRGDEAATQLARCELPVCAETALLKLDLEICRLADGSNWQPPFFHKLNAEAPSCLRHVVDSRIASMLDHGEICALAEDQRMATTANRDVLAVRRRWLLGEQP